ncbi:hypothetical protein BS50DRAFT_590512 [Corynespora cassiicola Philippines]|uniref:Uncharacterized protein n=1 Tax=Corynespora cassiicola Philippines TaxID=1448308 RepID=A0A2T2NHJ4_CORCC|nr:hypothetical protein BS50DRAFT_590512 [Corynespora cassiicola Philippines]
MYPPSSLNAPTHSATYGVFNPIAAYPSASSINTQPPSSPPSRTPTDQLPAELEAPLPTQEFSYPSATASLLGPHKISSQPKFYSQDKVHTLPHPGFPNYWALFALYKCRYACRLNTASRRLRETQNEVKRLSGRVDDLNAENEVLRATIDATLDELADYTALSLFPQDNKHCIYAASSAAHDAVRTPEQHAKFIQKQAKHMEPFLDLRPGDAEYEGPALPKGKKKCKAGLVRVKCPLRRRDGDNLEAGLCARHDRRGFEEFVKWVDESGVWACLGKGKVAVGDTCSESAEL